MAGNTIEAKLRIAGEVSDAVAKLRTLRKEVADTKAAAKTAGTGGDAAVADAKASAAARVAAERDVGEAAKAAARDKTAAARRASEDAIAAARAAAAETKRLAREAAADAGKVKKADDAQKRLAGQLAPQITDIAVGLASGQNPLTVALQQGGQIKDTIGFGNALKVLQGVLTPVRVLMGGAAAAVAVFAMNVLAGWRETDQMNKTLALSGTQANISAGQVTVLAAAMGDAGLSSRGFAREVLTGLMTVRGQTSATLADTARAAAGIAKISGQSAADVVKLFDGQADGITDWARKANQAYNFLTPQQLAYIQRLQSEGRNAEAVRFANSELAQTLESRSAKAIGLVERAWNAAAGTVSKYLDAIKSIGREETPEEKLLKIEKERAAIGARAVQREAGAADRRRGTETTGLARSDADAARDAQLEADRDAINRQKVRQAEKAADMTTAQKLIEKQEKGFQDSLAAITQAGAQRTLAIEQAALDRRQEAVELADARGLLTAKDKALKLNAIERGRLQAQQKQLQAQMGSEEAKNPTTEIDVNQKTSTLTQLTAQLVDVRSKIAGTTAAARQIVEADAIERTKQDTDEWQATWEAAYTKVRELAAQNATTAAGRSSDPAARAQGEAAANVESMASALREQLRAVQAARDTAKGPAKEEFQRQLDELQSAGNKALADATNKALFESYTHQLAEQLEALRIKEQEAADLAERGAIGTLEAERRKFDARAQALPQLEQTLALLQKIAAEPGAPPEQRNAVASLNLEFGKLKDTATAAEKTLRAAAGSGLTQFFTDIATGAKSGKQALLDMVASFAKALLNLINQRLAEKLLEQLTKAGSSTGDGGGGMWASLAGWVAKLFHTGGVVGAGVGGMARAISPLAFAGAQVLHDGGIAGLRSNERPAILEVGEEVLRADDPRHRNNYSGGAGQVNMQSSYTFNGSGGTDQDQRGAADELDRRMRATVQAWATEQRRQGGIFSGGGRG